MFFERNRGAANLWAFFPMQKMWCLVEESMNKKWLREKIEFIWLFRAVWIEFVWEFLACAALFVISLVILLKLILDK